MNNTGPTGTDVQGTNGSVNDKLDAGDTVVFTYSAAIAPASILSGWNGAAPRRSACASTTAARRTRWSSTTPPTRRRSNLLATGTALTINIDHVTAATLFNATIARSGSTFTVTIGSLISGAVTTEPEGQDAR